MSESPTEEPDATFSVSVLPIDTLLITESGPLADPAEVALAPDGRLQVLDGETGLVHTLDPRTRVRTASDTSRVLQVDLNPRGGGSAPLRVGRSDGAYWLVADSIPRLRLVGADGAIMQDRPVSASELTGIRVRQLYRADAATRSRGVRYVDDLRLVQGSPWVLLNRKAEERAVLLVFDPEGVQRGKIILPAAEGRRRFVVDPERKTVYLISSTVPQVAAVDLSQYPIVWGEGD